VGLKPSVRVLERTMDDIGRSPVRGWCLDGTPPVHRDEC
jgi:hypothetical protein